MDRNIRAFNGLRTIGAIGILIMHVLCTGDYSVNAWLYGKISVLSVFVEMFFILSGFCMCVGYYEKFKDGKISLNDFYIRRVQRTFPFFAVMIILDILLSFDGWSSLIGGIADATLLFAFLPNCSIDVVSVGWFLGVVFALYCLFPFIVFMLWNKKRAWLSLSVSLILCIFANYYFLNDGNVVRCNVLMWLPFFLWGGVLYLYRDCLERFVQSHFLTMRVITWVVIVLWLVVPETIYRHDITTLKSVPVFTLLICLCLAYQKGLLANSFTDFIGKYSMEIYLCHTAVFRGFQKFHVLSTGGIVTYVACCVLVFIGAIVFSVLVSKFIGCFLDKAQSRLKNNP